MTTKHRPRRWADKLGLLALTLAFATLCGVAQARYLEADPLRLGGGSYSIFGYAKQNPLRYVDPSGLQAVPPEEVPPEEAVPEEGGPMEFPSTTFEPKEPNIYPTEPIAPEPGQSSEPSNTLTGEPIVPVVTSRCSNQNPYGIPSNYRTEPTEGNGGTAYIDPNNKHNKVRVMPGNPDSSNPAQQIPYVVDQRSGTGRDADGNPVSLRGTNHDAVWCLDKQHAGMLAGAVIERFSRKGLDKG